MLNIRVTAIITLLALTPGLTARDCSEGAFQNQEESATATTAAPVSIPGSSGAFVPDEVLVRFDDSATKTEIASCLESSQASIASQIPALDVAKITVPTGKMTQAIVRFSGCSGVLYAEPNYIVRMTDTLPTDPRWRDQYGLLSIHAPSAWDMTTGATTVTIAILDTGVDLGHPDLASKIVPGYDFVNNDPIPQDDNYHGTHVAGIAAAVTNNQIGIAGVSWGARIMPVKVLKSNGRGSYADVAAGIVWAADHGAQVINLSLGGTELSSTLEDAVNYAYDKDVILVAASGNSGSDFVLYPARYPHVIAVAATGNGNRRAYFSNYGPEVDVSAPGVAILSTMPGNSYGYRSGTSMAAPFVAGLAAILRGLPSNDSPDEITQEIEKTALDLGIRGRDDFYGYGLIQMDAAIQSAWPASTPTFAPSPTYPPRSSLTPTATFTSTAQPTSTFTPTATSTSTPRPTPTFTLTGTATPTRSPQPTFTVTSPAPMANLALPAAGFAPNQVTILPQQPAEAAYAELGDLWLEIPSLAVKAPIVGIPLTADGWDVSWLGDQAGWLNGTAFPTHPGNSAIAAHVYDAYGQPGPFAHLSELRWGNQVILHAFGEEFVYSVRESMLVAPGAIPAAMRHEELPWLTLITCKGYDEASGSYRYRVVVRAVLASIK